MNPKSTFMPSLLALCVFLLASCNVKYDTVSFQSAGKTTGGTTPVPNVEIDTNISAGMFGGAVKSNQPYDIRAYYTDDTFTFASAEYTKVTVTYADGSTDPGIAAIKLPVSSKAEAYESHNSMAGGAIVVHKSRILRASFTDVVSRNEAFTLEIEGKFTKDDGSVIPFTIKEKYDISHQKGSESWVDFVSGC
ncbi:MAG: hypothetical protein RI957_1194 [Verrucomicrobiota bacterium]|jgi:hypothetical protein